MITALFSILMIYVFGKLFIFGLKAAWGFTRFVSACIVVPIILVSIVLIGAIKLVLPVLIIVASVMIIKRCMESVA